MTAARAQTLSAYHLLRVLLESSVCRCRNSKEIYNGKQCQVPPLCKMLVGERPPQAPPFTHGVPCGCAFLRNTSIRTGHAGEKDPDPAAARCPESDARFPERSKAGAFQLDPVCNLHKARSFPIAGFRILR